MDTNTFKNNLKTAKELILDEQKIITYMSLSKELCIHVNEAKSLLCYLVQDIRKNQPKTDIYVCYLISGILSNNSACTTVCGEADLDALKKTLKIIFYEHVYCVSRGLQAVDNVALTAINKFEDFSLCTGLIKANSCIKRTDNEIVNLKFCRNQNINVEASANNAIKKKAPVKPKDAVENGHEDVKNVLENVKNGFQVKAEPFIKSKTPSPKKDISSNNNKSIVKSIASKSASKGIAGFFNKANGDAKKPKNVVVKEENTTEIVKKEKEEEKVKIKVEPKSDDTITTPKPEPTNKSNNKTTDNSLKQIKKNAKVDKKRKRVLHVSDSESETEANDPFANDDNKMVIDHESDDEIPPTPSTNTVKITSGIVNPKKRRKIVDKTYTDEDGYILTKKEEVYESCSDNEEERKSSTKQEKENIEQVVKVKTETSPKENGKTKKKKVSPPQKGKQQTLTNFFKKV